MVYLVGLLYDLRGYAVPFAVDALALVFVVVIVVLTSRWWEVGGRPVPKDRARVFLALAGLGLLVLIVGAVVESANPGDLTLNGPALLLLAVLFLNCLG